MRAIALAAALLALPAAAAAQDPAAPLPLRPAGVALVILEEPACTPLPGGGTSCAAPRLVLPELRPCTPRVAGCEQDRARMEAAQATGDTRTAALPTSGGRAPELLSIDGVDVRGWSADHARALLVGPAGTRATVVWRDEAGRHTLVRARTDVFAPGPGYSRVLATRHFVLHFRPNEARRARSLAGHAERVYAESGYPTDTRGRRAHYWVVPYGGAHGSGRGRVKPAVWGSWITGEVVEKFELSRSLAYVGFGLPGRAAGALGAHAGWTSPQRTHRWAVRYLKEGANIPGMQEFFDSQDEQSLREHVRQRYGDAALGRLWRSNLPFDQAAPAVLGVDEPELKAQWRRDLLALGPNPELPPRPAILAVALGWGALLLLGGIGLARRREVG
jgi:hypothetical protein